MTMTEMKTYKKTKWFQDPMYAIFLKSMEFKDIKYGISPKYSHQKIFNKTFSQTKYPKKFQQTFSTKTNFLSVYSQPENSEIETIFSQKRLHLPPPAHLKRQKPRPLLASYRSSSVYPGLIMPSTHCFRFVKYFRFFTLHISHCALHITHCTFLCISTAFLCIFMHLRSYILGLL